MPTQTLQIAVSPHTARFDAEHESKLESCLRDQAKHTKTMALTMPSQMTFSRSGVVQGGLRMSTTGLSQLCSLLSPGLSLFVNSLCTDKDSPDPELAIETLNEVVRLRFRSALEDRRLIIDTKEQRIDGIVGPNYVQLSNEELYKRSKQFVAKSDMPARFHGAALSGRRMMVQYRSDDAIIDDEDEADIWFGGYHFSNSEVGECAVRAATLLLRQICSNGAVSPIEEGGRLAHVKSDKFEQRFEALLDRVRKKAQEVDVIRSHIEELRETNLELGGPPEEHKERCLHLLKRLRKGGLSKRFASRVITRTLICSSNDIHPMSYYGSRKPTAKAVQSRNLYDLFNAITFESKNLPVSLREPAEQLAYLLLLGRFPII